MMKWKVTALLLMLFCSIAAFSQTTATIEGKVVDESGEALPGVLATLESPSIQGSRSAVSRANGVFLFRLLPPADFTATLTMDGMRTEKIEIRVGLGQTSRPTVVMRPASTQETMIVTAAADPVLDTSAVTAHFDKDFLDKIAGDRDQRTAAILAPGTTASAFGGQVAISGAPTHANSYLVNGVDSRFDNLRGGPGNAVIEDAIQETTVMTSSISAEYGNFGGGVINTITKSGGNDFSGSFRLALTNPDWSDRTPFERDNGIELEDATNKAYSVTLGGPIIKDRLWFFVAGFDTEETIQQSYTRGFAPTQSLIDAYGLDPNQSRPDARAIDGRMNTDTRYEIKLTGQVAEGHDIVASYTKRDDEQFNNGSAPLDEGGLWPYRNIPRELWSVNYRGIINDAFSVDILYSERESVFEERPSGHIQGDTRITGTLLRDRRTFGRFNSALFLGKPDEPRGNDTFRAKANYFMITDNLGSHDFVFGFEDFKDYRFANNRQSLNDWQFWSDVRFEGNTPIPIYSDGSTGGYQSRIIYYPIENPSLTSDLGVQSIFVNDTWTLNDRWRFNIGFRYDDRSSKAEDGQLVADDKKLAPRLLVEYDLNGDGKHQFSASYSTYVQRTGQGSQDVSTAGSPSFAWLNYEGPQTENYLDVIQWMNNTYGTDFFFDPLNHPNRQAWENDLFDNSLYDPNSLTQILGVIENGVVVPKTIDSPDVTEMRIGYQTRWGTRGFLKADFVLREFDDFYIDHTDLQTGPTPNGLNDLNLINNDDSDYERNYHAVQLQGRWRFNRNFNVFGNYTWSQVYGNIDGEGGDGVSSTTGTTTIYPEYNSFANRNPQGYLGPDQRHIARIWASYDLNTSFGSFNFSATQRYETGTPYDRVVTLSLTSGRDVQYGFPARSTSGYISPSSSTNYYIDPRGSNRAEDRMNTDLGVNWQLPISKLDLFVEIDIFNIFNEDSFYRGQSINTTVTSTNVPFNVFNDVPQEGVHFESDDEFGLAGSNGAYQLPRTYRIDLGIRF